MSEFKQYVKGDKIKSWEAIKILLEGGRVFFNNSPMDYSYFKSYPLGFACDFSEYYKCVEVKNLSIPACKVKELKEYIVDNFRESISRIEVLRLIDNLDK